MQQLLGTSSCKRVGRDQSEVNAGSTSMGIDSADIVAVETRSGLFKAIEELIPSTDRSTVLAWYTLFGTCGVAVGTIVTRGLVQNLQTNKDGHWSTPTESPSGLCCYGAFEFRPIPHTQHKI